jgi:hypothetical protein
LDETMKTKTGTWCRLDEIMKTKKRVKKNRNLMPCFLCCLQAPKCSPRKSRGIAAGNSGLAALLSLLDV